MSKNKQQAKNYKQFSITKLEEALASLGSLISGVVVNLKKYKQYSEEVDALITKYVKWDEESEEEVLIPADEYDDINDKLLYRQREILKFVSDCNKSSFSYIDLRKILLKSNYLATQLDKDMVELLNELLNIRNWTFHNPQSLMVATEEVMERAIPKELKGIAKIQPQINPLIITHVSYYDIPMLLSLYLHTDRRISQFELILKQMKADYNEMYQKVKNKPVYIKGPQDTTNAIFFERSLPNRLISSSTDISQISMAIQKSKYDGSTAVFNKWAISNFDEGSGNNATEESPAKS